MINPKIIIDNKAVAQIIYNVFIETIEKKEFKGKYKLRSYYLKSKIAKNIHLKYYNDANNNIMNLDSNGKKGSEWLFDICITEHCDITDIISYQSRADINTKILFAGELENGTTIKDFATDFGKLICSNADNYLYIQAFSHNSDNGRMKFINNKLDIIKNQLKTCINNDFVLAFVPTPIKVGNYDYWDRYKKDLTKWISIYIYSRSNNDFEIFSPEISK